MERRVVYPAVVTALGVVAVVLATRAAVPNPLPGVALGSEELLIAERAAAIFAVLFLASLILVRAVQGELPQELSGRGVAYARSDAVDELRDRLDTQLDAHDRSLEELEEAQAKLDERLAELEPRERDGDPG